MPNLNSTPQSNRIQIGIFGRTNSGKSSLLNALFEQNLAVVSDIRGTTTDPVIKSMELLPLGAVTFIDTPGLDDESELGIARIEKTKEILRHVDIALLVIDSTVDLQKTDSELISLFESTNVPYLTVYNKIDKLRKNTDNEKENINERSFNAANKTNAIYVSATTGENISKLKEQIPQLLITTSPQRQLVADLVSPNDTVILVVPIDESAPKGRLILPQQQVIRDCLKANATAIIVKPNQLRDTLTNQIRPPKLVITDSQVFDEVSKIVPRNIPLTSFSILFARYKGILEQAMVGAKVLSTIANGDKILICEGCSHHRQCEDIGTVKLPRWIKKFSNTLPEFEFTSGGQFPKDLKSYRLIIHCGGCMLNEKEMQYRSGLSQSVGIPMTNYGIAISYMSGILSRCIKIFDTAKMSI